MVKMEKNILIHDNKNLIKSLNHQINNIFSRNLFPIFLLLSLFLLMSLFNQYFLTSANLLTILKQIIINGILSIGMTFVIISGGIDLSVGSIMAFSGTVIAGLMINYSLDPIIASFIGLFIGVLFGFINGILVAYIKMPSIIVTLGMMEISRSLALLFSKGYPLTELPESFSYLGRGYLFNTIPISLIIMLLLYIISYIILNYLPLGRYIYAIGSSESAFKLSGININKYKLFAFVISGLTASISGLIISSRLMSGQPMVGVGFELDSISAVVLGGTDITGGSGHIYGTLIGVLILGVLSNGLSLMGFSPYIQRFFKGVIIVIAVYLSLRKKKYSQ